MILNIKYNPKMDFTPERRKEIYSEFKEFLKETEEDNNLFPYEKQRLRREILEEIQMYEAKYDTYQENIEIVKKLFLKEKINYFSLN